MRLSPTIRILTFSTLLATPITAQVNQYYEQYRSSGNVSGGCESLLAFSKKVQNIFSNTQWVGIGEQIQEVSGNRKMYYSSTLKDDYKDCTDCCLRTAKFTSTITLSSLDQFGGLEGNFSRDEQEIKQVDNDKYYGKHYNTLKINCEAAPAPASTQGQVSMRFPVVGSGSSCSMSMPKIVFTDADTNDEYTVKIITTTSFVRVAADGAERTYKRIR